MHARLDRDIMTVICHNYHDGEYPFDRATYSTAVHVRYLWDNNLRELADMAFPAAQWTDVSDEAQYLFEKFLKTQVGYLNLTCDDTHDLIGQSIFIVSGSAERVFSAFEAYANMLMADVSAGGPGADDGTYDYFPGAVETCRQLADAFVEVGHRPKAARAKYNALVDIARETHYRGNEEADDLLPYMTMTGGA